MVSKRIKSALWAAALCAVAPCSGGAATPQVDSPGLPSDADLLQVDTADWPHFNRTYSGDRYSPLAGINVSNATAGGGIAGGISTYSVEGEQLIAVPSGNSACHMGHLDCVAN